MNGEKPANKSRFGLPGLLLALSPITIWPIMVFIGILLRVNAPIARLIGGSFCLFVALGFALSLIGLFRDSSKGYAIAGFCISSFFLAVLFSRLLGYGILR